MARPNEPLWDFLNADEFKAPSAATGDAARSVTRRVWEAATQVFREPDAERIREEDDRDRPDAKQARSLCPDPDWNDVAHALRDRIGDGLGDGLVDAKRGSGTIQAIVGPPGVKVSEALRALAEEEDLLLVEPPNVDDLLDERDAVRDAIQPLLTDDPRPAAILNLERWFLRHEHGFDGLRELIDVVESHQPGALLGCGSWAWAFLQPALGIEDSLGAPLTLAAFDADRLSVWIADSLAADRCDLLHCEDCGPLFSNASEADGVSDATRRLMERIASRSRGNPAVALALFRSCLRTSNGRDSKASVDDNRRPRYWVASPDDVAAPELLAAFERLHRFVLHDVLLHDGLSLSALERALPFFRGDVRGCVRSLRRSGVLVEREGRLEVDLIAYPWIRRDLKNEGFLTDAF